jgi:aminoglycoside N3'-acetyltransferase
VQPLIPKRLLPRARKTALCLRRIELACRGKISQSDFTRILEGRIGLKKGAVVFVHSSATKMNLDFPVYRVLSILHQIIGPEGTMLFPSWNDELSATFDLRATPTTMGLIAEAARRVPGAIRSLHPTTSMLAIGADAEELTETHSLSKAPLDENSPLMKLVRRGGLIIGLGVTSDSLSLIHCPESILLDRFPHPRFIPETFSAPIINETGALKHIELYKPAAIHAHKDIRTYIRRYLDAFVDDFRVRGVDFFACDASGAYRQMSDLAERGVTMYASHRHPFRFVDSILSSISRSAEDRRSSRTPPARRG